jgi:hypothetical protein
MGARIKKHAILFCCRNINQSSYSGVDNSYCNQIDGITIIKRTKIFLGSQLNARLVIFLKDI